MTLPIELVIARGEVLAEHGKLTADIPAFAYPATAKNTVNMKRDLTAADFDIAAPKGANEVTARVIGVIENQAPTTALEKRLKVASGLVDADTDVRRLPDRGGRAPQGHGRRQPTPSSRASATMSTARWPRPWPMTATT